MKILYCVRLFSGFQQSVENGQWRPTGVPTIYRMMERLDHDGHDVAFMLACKDDNVTWHSSRDTQMTLAGLATPVSVLAGIRRWSHLPRRLREPLRELSHAIAVWRCYRRERPELVYLDHANVFVAGFLAVTTRARIVFRVMGIYPIMRAALVGGGWRNRLLRWCYRRRFGLVVCTQDGSGIERWLEDAIRPEVPRIALINGMDRIAASTADNSVDAIPDAATVVLFIGKLEPEKGALAFTDGFLTAWRRQPDQMFGLIVGTGSDAAEIGRRIDAAGARHAVRMIDRLPHAVALALLERADIYVSLNRLGNLSNANLEALASGRCMIIPAPQPDLGIDMTTDRLIPPEAALRISATDDTAGLAEAILALAGDPKRRACMGDAAKRVGTALLTDWNTRIDAELTLLTRLAEGANPAEWIDRLSGKELHAG